MSLFCIGKEKRLGYNPWRIKYYKQNVIYTGIQTTPSSLIDKFFWVNYIRISDSFFENQIEFF